MYSGRPAMALAAAAAVLTPAAAAQAQTAFHLGSEAEQEALAQATPFADNNGATPDPGAYDGPLFKLSHDWPSSGEPLTDTPWQAAISNGLITVENAPAYADALKQAVTDNSRALLQNYDTWDAAAAGWYNEPWLGSIREAIHGTYAAGAFGPAIFPDTGLHAEFQTHVLTYYDSLAATSLHNFWNADAMTPNLETAKAQFIEGAIIVKAALFASTDPEMPTDWWDAMKGTQEWPLFLSLDDAQGNPMPPQVWPSYLAQYDIIVKDSQSSPQTGWVFMTLVYDADAPGEDVWEKMVPLGVQWGNDPEATSADMPLTENWINPEAPKYSTQTLGWGGRLSGPNDGGRNDIVVDGEFMANAPNSGCISCHSTSQWNIDEGRMVSFLLPSYPTDSAPYFKLCDYTDKDGKPQQAICSPAPGTDEWMKWFQNRAGDVAMDEGSFATDFDEVFSFKSLPLWKKATAAAAMAGAEDDAEATGMLKAATPARRFNQYTGAPLPQK